MDLFKINSVCGISLESIARGIGLFQLVGYGTFFVVHFCYNLALEMRYTEESLHILLNSIGHMAENAALLFTCVFGGFLYLGAQQQSRELVLSWILLAISSLIATFVTLVFFEFRHYHDGVYELVGVVVNAIWDSSMLYLVVNYYNTIAKGNLRSEDDNEHEGDI